MTENEVRDWLGSSRALRQEVKALRRVRQARGRRDENSVCCGPLCEKLRQRAEELCRQEQAVLEAIAGVEESRLRAVLTERYLEGRTWEQIAEDMGYCVMQVSRLHKQALHVLAAGCEPAAG